MKPEIKKLLILNAPYLLFVYLFDKVGQAVRLAPGGGDAPVRFGLLAGDYLPAIGATATPAGE